MSALPANDSFVPKRRNLEADQQNGGGVDREATLHHRRKTAMVSLMSEFEREIERHVKPGHEQEIKHFKRSCRSKLNGLTFLACELIQLQPGEEVNGVAADLAEELAFDGNGGHENS